MQLGNGFLGMNIEGVTRVANSIEAQASRINTILTTLDRLVQDTHWVGPDHDKFVAEWIGLPVVAMCNAMDDMRQTAAQVQTNIKLQIQTSGH